MMTRFFTSSNFLAILIFLLPVTIVTVDDAESAILTILAVWGIYLFIKHRINPLQWDKALLPVLLAFAGVFVVDVLSYTFAEYRANHIGALDGGLRFLLFIPIFAVLMYHEIDFRSLRLGSFVGGVLVGTIAIVQYLNPSEPYWNRAHGSTHPIIFGDISLILAAINLIYLLEIKDRFNYYHLLGMIFSLSGMFLSGTRGAWLALPVLGLLLVALKWKEVSKLKIIVSLVGATMIVGAVYSIPQTGVKNRVERALTELKNYNNSPIDSEQRGTSVGLRLEMWQAAWTMFVQHPFLGVGTRNYYSEANKQADAGLRYKAIKTPGLYHAHNDYIWFMAEKGIMGLTAVLAVFLAPFIYFYMQYQQHRGIYNVVAMAVIAAYMTMSLTEALFARNPPKTFYILSIAILLAMSLKSRPRTEDA